MRHLIEQRDIAQLLGVSEDTVRRQLKAAKVNHREFPELVRWLYPRLMLAWEQGIDYRKTWKAVLQRQQDEKKQPSEKQLRVLALERNRRNAGLVRPQPTVLPPFEDRPQEFPSYD